MDFLLSGAYGEDTDAVNRKVLSLWPSVEENHRALDTNTGVVPNGAPLCFDTRPIYELDDSERVLMHAYISNLPRGSVLPNHPAFVMTNLARIVLAFD